MQGRARVKQQSHGIERVTQSIPINAAMRDTVSATGQIRSDLAAERSRARSETSRRSLPNLGTTIDGKSPEERLNSSMFRAGATTISRAQRKVPLALERADRSER